MTTKYRALFTPYIGIEYDEAGIVLGADVDWDSTFQNVYEVDGGEVTTFSDHPVASLVVAHMDAYIVGKGDSGGAALLRHVADLIDLQ